MHCTCTCVYYSVYVHINIYTWFSWAMQFFCRLVVFVTFSLRIGSKRHGRSVLGTVSSFEHGTGSIEFVLHESEELSLLSVCAWSRATSNFFILENRLGNLVRMCSYMYIGKKVLLCQALWFEILTLNQGINIEWNFNLELQPLLLTFVKMSVLYLRCKHYGTHSNVFC